MKNECLQAVTEELSAANVPYRVERAGKHLRVRYGRDHEHTQILPKTASDHRAAMNARADVRRTIRLQGLSELAAREATR